MDVSMPCRYCVQQGRECDEKYTAYRKRLVDSRRSMNSDNERLWSSDSTPQTPSILSDATLTSSPWTHFTTQSPPYSHSPIMRPPAPVPWADSDFDDPYRDGVFPPSEQLIFEPNQVPKLAPLPSISPNESSTADQVLNKAHNTSQGLDLLYEAARESTSDHGESADTHDQEK